MNNEQRETKEIKVGEHTLVVNTYLTGREARTIEGVMMDKLEMSQSTKDGDEKGETMITGFKGSILSDRQDLQVKAVIVSFDGKTENILDTILDLPRDDSEEVMKIVSEIAEPKKKADGK